MGKEKKKKEEKRKTFISFWNKRLLDVLKKDISMHPKLRDYNFYTDGYGTYSGKDLISFYYTIDGYPKALPIDLRKMIRGEARGGVKISFISTFEPTIIDWSSPRMVSKLRVWRSINQEEESKDIDEFNYQENVDMMDSNVWRKESLIYLADADKRRRRKFFIYRTLMIICGERGEDFDKTVTNIKLYCKNQGVQITRVDSDIFDYLSYFSPFSQEINSKVIKNVGNNTIPDELLARMSSYDQGKIGLGGDYWGTDLYSGFPVYKVVKKNSVDAENILITAKTGGGKSFFLKMILLQLIAKTQYNGTVNDIEGFEYIPMAGFLANQDNVVILNMAEGQGCYFDPVEINLTGKKDLDRDMYGLSRSFTIAIIKTLLGENLSQDDWSNILVNNAVSRVYSSKDIDPKDMDTWKNSKGLSLFDVYEEFKELYKDCIEVVREYGYSDSIKAGEEPEWIEDEDILFQYKRNKMYRKTLDLVIAKLSAYFEDLSNGGIRSEIFSQRVTLDDIRQAKFLICSFGMAGKSMNSVDPIQMGLSQLSASNISHIRSVFSKAEGKYNFKVWEEFQRWGSFPDADKAIKTALTGGRKLGDINFIVTNNVKEILDNDRFAIFDNITSSVIGAISDSDTRSELCRRLSISNLQEEVDNIGTSEGDVETFKGDVHAFSFYDKAFLVHLDESVSTVVRMEVPDYIAKSNIFRTGVDLGMEE